MSLVVFQRLVLISALASCARGLGRVTQSSRFECRPGAVERKRCIGDVCVRPVRYFPHAIYWDLCRESCGDRRLCGKEEAVHVHVYMSGDLYTCTRTYHFGVYVFACGIVGMG